MPEYWVIVNDPDTYPEYAYNERIIDTEFFTIYDNRPSREDALTMATIGYSRMRITTEFYEFMKPGHRPPASHYYFTGTMPPAARFVNYVPAGIAAVLRSTQSGVGSSLPSKPKTPGKSYRPGRGKKCRPGYQLINGMCVSRKKRSY